LQTSVPQLGIIFSAIFVVFGFALMALGAGVLQWTLWLCLIFPIIYPFTAIAIVIKSVLAEKDHHLLWFGGVIAFVLILWAAFTYFVLAVVLHIPILDGNIEFVEMNMTAGRIAASIIYALFSAGVMFALFAVTVWALPVILDKELDMITAALISVDAVRQNLGWMLVWGFASALLLAVSLLPYFLGLFIALPLLGHTTWHLYHRILVY